MPDKSPWIPSVENINHFASAILPPADPTPYMLIKGHLLFEHYLKEIIREAATIEKWTPDPRASFVGMTNTAETHNLLPIEVLKALRELDTVRNQYAHRFFKQVSRDDIDNIAKPVATKFYAMFKGYDGEHTVEESFRNLLIYLWMTMFSARVLISHPEALAFIRNQQKVATTCYKVDVSKEEIATGDISATLALFSGCIGSKESVLMVMGRISLHIEGCEIDYNAFVTDQKLRRYIAKLDEAFPYLLLFLELETRMAANLFMSLSTPHSKSNESWLFLPEELDKFLEPRLESINCLCGQFGLNAEAVDRAIAVKHYFSEKM